ncbi:maker525 [Drosophila busckii]|uniref:Metalloendopeptidase n=1 Tax=Drosophila busckii TaxID=30019 RepID=A0A0M3QU01_DROBS|nr:maker525 [Drosophila busckii]
MYNISLDSCVRFRQTYDPNEHQVIINGGGAGCSAHLGYQHSRYQKIHFGGGCIERGVIKHELLHALGFVHMHSDARRDDYVIIEWDNIQEGREHNFERYNNTDVTDFGVEYDYLSVLHYGSHAFSKNGRPTIISKRPDKRFGQRMGLTALDTEKLNRAYCYKQK